MAVEAAVIKWREGHNYPPPVSPSSSRQKAWDLPHVEETYDQLLQGASDCRSRARLLAAVTKESGAWLNALPVSSPGLRMDDHTTRITMYCIIIINFIDSTLFINDNTGECMNCYDKQQIKVNSQGQNIWR